MCIIVAKNRKSKLPTKQTLENCFNNNNDGAGFMYVNENHQVVIDKGYMTFNDFYSHYKKLKKRYNNFKNKALVMHFRIGTSGSNTPGNTHPYPVTPNLSNLKKTYFTTNLGVAHNGIISYYTPKDKKDYNDTQNFIMKYLSKLYSHYPTFYKDKDIMYGVEQVCGSKLCFLNTDEELFYVGEFILDKGIMYSNSTYTTSYFYSQYYNNVLDYNYDYLELLPEWTIVHNDGTEEIVGDKLYCINDYNDLFEVTEDGSYSLIELEVKVKDELGEVII